MKKEEPSEGDDYVLVAVPKQFPPNLILRVNEGEVVLLSVATIVEDFMALLGPPLHKKMKRVYSRAGPFTGDFQVPRSLAAVIFEGASERRFESDEAVEGFLGHWRKRQYRYSYGVIIPPFKDTVWVSPQEKK